jgi:RNA polymerase sigma-70 factor (sigma-E family)
MALPIAYRTKGSDASRGRSVGVRISDPRDAQLSALFEEHRLWLVRLATLLVDDQGLAEDVVQSAYLGLYRHWAERDEAHTIAYLRTSVVNGARSMLRRRKIDREQLSFVTDDVIDTRPDAAPGPEQTLERAEQRRRILDQVRRLPRRQREVLVLRYWAELSEAQIASTLGISVGTVKSTASRGIDALAKRWEEAQ